MGQLLERLGASCPQLAPHLEHGIAVAIDGMIYHDAWLQPIGSATRWSSSTASPAVELAKDELQLP